MLALPTLGPLRLPLGKPQKSSLPVGSMTEWIAYSGSLNGAFVQRPISSRRRSRRGGPGELQRGLPLLPSLPPLLLRGQGTPLPLLAAFVGAFLGVLVGVLSTEDLDLNRVLLSLRHAVIGDPVGARSANRDRDRDQGTENWIERRYQNPQTPI